MKRLEFEMQRLELEQQLEDMRERMARDKKTRQQEVAHEQWVTEQKRNLQAIKIEKARRHVDSVYLVVSRTDTWVCLECVVGCASCSVGGPLQQYHCRQTLHSPTLVRRQHRWYT